MTNSSENTGKPTDQNSGDAIGGQDNSQSPDARDRMLTRRTKQLNEIRGANETFLNLLGVADLDTARQEFETLRDLKATHEARLTELEGLNADLLASVKEHENAATQLRLNNHIEGLLNDANVLCSKRSHFERIVRGDWFLSEDGTVEHHDGMSRADYIQFMRTTLPEWIASNAPSGVDTGNPASGSDLFGRLVDPRDPTSVAAHFDDVAGGRANFKK